MPQSYQEAVAEIRRLEDVIQEAEGKAEQARWDQARLAWEQTKPRGTASYDQLSADAGVSRATVTRWVAIHKRFGARLAGEAEISYSVAYQAVDKNLGTEDVYAERNLNEARRTVRNMPAEKRAEVVREALADPDVAGQVMRDPETRSQVAKAEAEVYSGRQTAAEADYELHNPRSHSIERAAALEYELTKARLAFESALSIGEEAGPGWDAEDRRRVIDLARRAVAAGEQFIAMADREAFERGARAATGGM